MPAGHGFGRGPDLRVNLLLDPGGPQGTDCMFEFRHAPAQPAEFLDVLRHQATRLATRQACDLSLQHGFDFSHDVLRGTVLNVG